MDGISHITLICKDIEKSALLFSSLFNAKELYSSGQQTFSLSKEKFFVLGNTWFALMEGSSIERSYNHIAFHVTEKELLRCTTQIQLLGLDILPGRPRHEREGTSLYFYDYDNHLFELHTGDLATRLAFYESQFSDRLV
jgi:catechol 2,3-dioxygenase-like lactoylglutathione lyase family enzyme